MREFVIQAGEPAYVVVKGQNEERVYPIESSSKKGTAQLGKPKTVLNQNNIKK